jgi:hypothetical protein
MSALKFSSIYNEADVSLVLEAFDALRRTTSLKGELVDLDCPMVGYYTPDAMVDVTYTDGKYRYFVDCKSSVDRRAQLDAVKRQLDAIDPSHGLLITPYVTKELSEHCRAIDLQFVDTCGNAYLHAPGLYVLVTGEKNERGQRSLKPPRGLTNAAGLRVVFALLCKPELVTAPLKQIASQAGVSLGTAYNALEDLERRGYLINRSNADRRVLLERRRLMEEWVINYPSTLRPKLENRRFSAPDPQWWKKADLLDVEYAWGGEVAANKMTKYLKPATQTLYVESSDMGTFIKSLALEHRIRPDPDGDVEVLEKFWHWEAQSKSHVAPPLLVYSELLALLDPRAQETADVIKEHFIDPTFD